MGNNYNLSILIPGWNAEKYIKNCVESLLKNIYTKYKIIIIAGGLDKSFEIACQFQKRHPNRIKVLEQKIPNKSKALNLGLKEVKGDIIVITDIDCIYQKDWLKNINDIFHNRKINVITGLYLPYQHRNNSLAEFNKIKFGYNIIKFSDKKIIIGNKLCGANSAFRKEIFMKKIGCFDESARTGEDKLLGMEFNKKGEDLYFFEDIYVYTECYSDNLRKYIKHRIRWARDLFIDFNIKNIPQLLYLLSIGIFKLLYPPSVLFLWLLFFNFSIICLLLFISPWIAFYLFFIIKTFIESRKYCERVNNQLGTNFNYKKAFRIIPLMFFIYGIISIISFIKPRKKEWF